MRSEQPYRGSVRLVTVFAAIVSSLCHAQAAPEPAPDGRAALPGEYPEHRYRSPFPGQRSKESSDFDDNYLSGDWLGARSKLADRGVRLALLLITDPFASVVGGRERGISGYNLVGADFFFKTDPLLGWRGAEFHVGGAGNYGTSLSTAFVGNSFPVQLADVADAYVRLTYLSYTQSLLDEALSLRIGRLTINSVYGEEFLASEYCKAFTSVGIDLVPLGIFLNAPGAFGYPDTTWGARVKLEPAKQFYAMVGAYNGDPKLKDGARHGVDFSLRGPLFLIGELGLRRNYGKDAAGLAGNLKLGGYADEGRYGLYLVGDQELFRWGDAAQGRHVGAFGALTITPDWRASKAPLFFDTGLVLYGPARSRAKDSIGVAIAYAQYQASAFEMTVEGTYRLRVAPGFEVQPNVQYIVHPSGSRTLPDALAIGVNIVVTL
jgi:porin